MNKRLVGVTGAAGTGKTTILKEAYHELVGRGLVVALAAPTGKAAKRITEATGLPASTVHRLLEFPKPGDIDEKTGKATRTGYPKRCKQNPLDADAVFIDEAAMVHNDLYRFIIDALPGNGVVRMFGDINQLPPIEENKANKLLPSPFSITLAKHPSVQLDIVHRQAEGSGVLDNSQRILRGLPPVKRDDFDVLHTELPVNVLLKECEKYDFRSIDNQIITPTNNGWVGVTALNNRVQMILNNRPDPNQWMQLPRHEWHEENREKAGLNGKFLNIAVGDKVVQTKNDYTLEVFNGETGVVLEVDRDSGYLVVDFGDRELAIPPVVEIENPDGGTFYRDPRADIDLAYVLTTHKCQGSEFETVLYVMNRSRSFNLNRSNFYTAVTRARKRCIVVSDLYSIRLSLSKQVKR